MTGRRKRSARSIDADQAAARRLMGQGWIVISPDEQGDWIIINPADIDRIEAAMHEIIETMHKRSRA